MEYDAGYRKLSGSPPMSNRFLNGPQLAPPENYIKNPLINFLRYFADAHTHIQAHRKMITLHVRTR